MWYHVHVSFGEDGLSLLLNDTEVDTDPYTGGLGTSSGGSGNTEPIVLGARQDDTNDETSSGASDFFDGLIDDLKMSTPTNSGYSEEVELASHTDASGGSLKDAKIDTNKWIAQYFEPNLDPSTTFWTVGRVQLNAKYDKNTGGVFKVQIRTADGNQKPTDTVLEEITVYESELRKNYDWVEFTFSNVLDIDANDGLCIVVQHVSGDGTVAKFRYEESGSPMTANTHFMTSSDGGNSWSTPDDSKDLLFFVFGAEAQ